MTAPARPLVVVAGKINPAGVAQLESETRVVIAPDLAVKTVIELSREHLLARVWGNRYEGGPSTVDIHVRRLRAKLGTALPLETLRGTGYKLRAPDAEESASRDVPIEAEEDE